MELGTSADFPTNLDLEVKHQPFQRSWKQKTLCIHARLKTLDRAGKGTMPVTEFSPEVTRLPQNVDEFFFFSRGESCNMKNGIILPIYIGIILNHDKDPY